MNNFTIWTADNPQPKPIQRSVAFIANRVAFIKAKAGNTDFYIAAADDPGEVITIRSLQCQ